MAGTRSAGLVVSRGTGVLQTKHNGGWLRLCTLWRNFSGIRNKGDFIKLLSSGGIFLAYSIAPRVKTVKKKSLYCMNRFANPSQTPRLPTFRPTPKQAPQKKYANCDI